VTAGRAQHPRLQVVEGHFIRPAIGIQFCLMLAPIVAAEHQDAASTEAAHRPERRWFRRESEIGTRPRHRGRLVHVKCGRHQPAVAANATPLGRVY